MFTVRAASAKDVEQIVAIEPVPPERADEIMALVVGGACHVALEEAAIVGFIGVRVHHFYGRDFVDLLFVAPSARRRGLGRNLLRAALKGAWTPRVFTSTNQSNAPMRSLLANEGWTPGGVLNGLDEGDPEHVFFHDVDGG